MLLTKQAEEPGRGRLETSGHPKEHRRELCMCPSSTPYWSFGTWSLKKLIIRNMVNLSRADSPALAQRTKKGWPYMMADLQTENFGLQIPQKNL